MRARRRTQRQREDQAVAHVMATAFWGSCPRGAALGGAVRRAGAELRPGRAERRAPVGAEVRRRNALVAAERLRELGGLAVADAMRDLADGQRTGGQHL